MSTPKRRFNLLSLTFIVLSYGLFLLFIFCCSNGGYGGETVFGPDVEFLGEPYRTDRSSLCVSVSS